MSKEELINNIAEADRLGKELEKSTKTMAEARDKLLLQADKIELDIEQGVNTMTELAVALTEMRKVLKEKYGSFVM